MDPVVIKRIFPCNKRTLFEAWSRPSIIAQWFFSSQQPRKPSTVDNSFTVGGHYEVVMHLPAGAFRMHGHYHAINRYHHIAFSWSSHIINNSLVQLDFKELSPNRTEMTLTQSGFPDDEVRNSHINGWSRCLENLEIYINPQGRDDQLIFSWGRLEDMSGVQVHEILQARESVFIVEQNCPYQDADGCDAHAWHMTGRINGSLACYVRLVDPGHKYPEPSIGRVLTTAGFRGLRLGRPMMQEAIQQTNILYPGQNIQIGAQAHLREFYRSLGFEQCSEEYLEDGIPHILMFWRYPADNDVNPITK